MQEHQEMLHHLTLGPKQLEWPSGCQAWKMTSFSELQVSPVGQRATESHPEPYSLACPKGSALPQRSRSPAKGLRKGCFEVGRTAICCASWATACCTTMPNRLARPRSMRALAVPMSGHPVLRSGQCANLSYATQLTLNLPRCRSGAAPLPAE